MNVKSEDNYEDVIQVLEKDRIFERWEFLKAYLDFKENCPFNTFMSKEGIRKQFDDAKETGIVGIFKIYIADLECNGKDVKFFMKVMPGEISEIRVFDDMFALKKLSERKGCEALQELYELFSKNNLEEIANYKQALELFERIQLVYDKYKDEVIKKAGNKLVEIISKYRDL